jgi:hypothetical protein
MITHIILFAYGWAVLFGFGVVPSTSEPSEPATAETRCGWFENPTPANAWLVDRDGEWTIAVQGGYQAEGDWPDFKDNQWVKTNINYGYGCACMKVTTDRADRRILTIHSATAKPLSTCRKDKAIKKKEPKWDS